MRTFNGDAFVKVRDAGRRALAVAGVYIDTPTLAMDLMNAHNDVGLDFEVLSEAADTASEYHGDFVHDIAGIVRHMDRDTGKLGGLFLPRFALKEGSPHVA